MYFNDLPSYVCKVSNIGRYVGNFLLTWLVYISPWILQIFIRNWDERTLYTQPIQAYKSPVG